jgi:hypothetical protein
MKWRTTASIALCGLLSLGLASPVQAGPKGPSPEQTSPKKPSDKPIKPVDLDIMFIGAHPDDEAGQLGMLAGPASKTSTTWTPLTSGTPPALR